MKLELIEQKAANPNDLPPLLFVHGSSHGAWCWEDYYIPYFAEKGWDNYALSFRSHGQSEGREAIHENTLDDYTHDVLQIINQQEIKPVLIGHSLGGGVAQLVLNGWAEKIAGVVLIGASAPGGPTLADYWHIFKSPLTAIRVFQALSGKTMTAAQTRKSPFFDGRISEQQAERYRHLVQPESKLISGELSKSFRPTSGKPSVPILVTGSQKDSLVPEKAIQITAKHYETDAVMFKSGAHDLMVDQNWEESASYIERWMQKQFA